MNVTAIILAAGASKRLGRPKQLVRINDETLIDRTIRIAREAGIAHIIVVLGANADAIRHSAKLQNVQITINNEWQKGMASSIRNGLGALPPETEAIVLLNCDQPAVTPAHLQALIAELSHSSIAASTYADRTGTPAAFLHQQVEDLKSLRGDQGARSLLRGDEVARLALPDGDFDIDTPEDLARLENFSA